MFEGAIVSSGWTFCGNWLPPWGLIVGPLRAMLPEPELQEFGELDTFDREGLT